MKIVSIFEVKEGEFLGRNVYTPEGYILLRRGVSLERKHIDSLKRFNISYIAVFESEDEKKIYERSSNLVENPFLGKVRKAYIGLRMSLSYFRKTSFQIFDWGDVDLILKRIDKTFQSKKAEITFFIELGKKVIWAILMELLRGERKLLGLGSFSYEDGGMLWEHWLNVSVLSMFTAFNLGYKIKRICEIGISALFHDIGKLFLNADDFFKNSFLNRNNIDPAIALHPLLGYCLLRNLRDLPIRISHVLYQHHENFDGSGYPQGLKKGGIIGETRIVAVCNYFDALLSGRFGFLPTMEEAISNIEGLSEKRFDPKVLDVFLNDVLRKNML